MNGPTDTLRLDLGPLPCRIGVLPGENDEPQEVSASIALELDLDAVLQSGALEDSVDYAPLHAQVVAAMCDQRWGLIEELGAELMRLGLSAERVRAATVRVTKLAPPLGRGTGPVTLEFRREASR